jgi:hypothetical protein
MGIAMTTDDENRTTVVVNAIVACGCAFAGQMSWLHLTDDQGNRINLHMTREQAQRLHATWAATAPIDASDAARSVA